MRINSRRKNNGFTLIETMLVAVIIAMVLYGTINFMTQRAEQARIDRSSLQMQQILNAGLAYYLQNSAWPPNIGCLQGSGGGLCTNAYLPNPFNSPWAGAAYTAGPGSNPALFTVSVTVEGAIKGAATAKALAGTLPLSNASGLVVTASVNIPGQNLNNARAVNFAGLYHQGACVPVPVCPVDPNSGVSMVPQIIVAPVQVSGVNDPSSSNVYPISSFTAYATGNATPPTNTSPPACTNSTVTPSCPALSAPYSAYWRVCMQVVTEKGDIQSTNTSSWGNYVTMLAITRCVVASEPSGTPITTWGN